MTHRIRPDGRLSVARDSTEERRSAPKRWQATRLLTKTSGEDVTNAVDEKFLCKRPPYRPRRCVDEFGVRETIERPIRPRRIEPDAMREGANIACSPRWIEVAHGGCEQDDDVLAFEHEAIVRVFVSCIDT